jgi:hypothetical protein
VGKLKSYELWLAVLSVTLMSFGWGCGGTAHEAKDASAPQAEEGERRYMDFSAGTAQTPAPMAPADSPEVAPGKPAADTDAGNSLGAPAPAPAPPPPAGADPADESTTAGGNVLATGDRPTPLLIYRATLTMAVFETRKSMDAIEQFAKKSGGYLVARNDLTITVRVPAPRFDAALNQIAKEGDELHRQVDVTDVTEQYNDLSIELKNAEAVRERLVALLEKAQKVEEALAVEAELARLTDKIERIKGKLKLFNELIAFSTVTVQFQPRPVEKINSNVTLPFPWLKQLGLPELLSL